jgi:acyl-CoA synthetase (NDP forming)
VTKKRLDSILKAQSVAVIGASDDLAKVGGRVVYLLQQRNFAGEIFPVNPKRTHIQGLACYAAVAAIAQPIDLCVLAVAASEVHQQATLCLEAGARGLIVLSSGYAELDGDGARRQVALAELAQRYDVPLIGPNCLGIMNANNSLVASSTFAINDRELQGGRLSFVSQSGAIGTYWLDMVLEAGFGVANWISTGNEADVDLAELLEYLVEDEQTSVIGLYIEGIRDGQRFRRAALRALQKKKPILVLKAGRSAAGALAAASHTGALAGEDLLYDAFFEQYGLCRVDSLTEMLELSKVLLLQPVRAGVRTCVVSVSGGAGVLIADAANANGLLIPELSPALVANLRTILPAFATAQNPLDVTAQIATEPELLGKAVQIITASNEFDAVVVFCGGLGNLQRPIAESIVRGLGKGDRPCVVIWQAHRPEAMRLLAEANIPTFSEIPPAVQALARAVRLADRWLASVPQEPSLFVTHSTKGAVALTEYESKLLLKEKSVLKIPEAVLVHSGPELSRSAASLPAGPFAVKLQSLQLLHKSGNGGIVLGLKDALAVTVAVDEMFALAAKQNLGSVSVLIEKMQSVQFEFLVGLRREPALGAVLTLGRGGVAVEIDPDLVHLFLPVSAQQVLDVFERLRGSRLYSGFRGQQAAPLKELVRVICSLIEMFEFDESIVEIEVNPLASDEQGEVVALDAAVWLRASDDSDSR